jgi:adenylate cyclase
MLGQLMPCGGGPPIPLVKPKLLVGRHSTCDVPIRLVTVSARHCELELRDGYWFVRDLGSTNGTRVNGKVCTSAQRLMPNDVLWLAQFRFKVIYTAPPAPELPPAEVPAAREEQPAPEPVPAADEAAEEETLLGELVPCGGGDPIALTKPLLVVGRSSACDIVLRFTYVSSRHCQLEWDNGSWFVRDLGSHNGIRIDGVRCPSGPLPPGSVLGIATLRYHVHYGAGGADPAQHPLFARSLLEKAGLQRWRGPSGPAAADDEGPPRKVWRIDDFS